MGLMFFVFARMVFTEIVILPGVWFFHDGKGGLLHTHKWQ